MHDDDEPIPEVVVVPLEDHIDLHFFLPRDIKDVVTGYLDEAAGAGWREVRIIHGRGTGTQREIVRRVLERHPAVSGFTIAPPERGGSGATLVTLRLLSPRENGPEGGPP